MEKLILLLIFIISCLPSFSQVSPAWVVVYDASPTTYGGAVINDMVLDNAGNVYVTGSTSGFGTAADYLTIKYSPNGIKLWEKKYNYTANDIDIALRIILDDSSNVIVTGWSEGFGGFEAIQTVKYNNNGDFLWEKRYSSTFMPTAIRTDSYGNIYIAGYTVGSVFTAKLIKYDLNGNQLWVKTHVSNTRATDCILDSDNNIYIVGWKFDGSSTQRDGLLAKYNNNGTLIWTKTYHKNFEEQFYNVVIDNNQNLYISGSATDTLLNPSTLSLILTCKYDSSGTLIWDKIHPEYGYVAYDNFGGQQKSIIIDDSSNVYVTMYSELNNTPYIFISKYDSSGSQKWFDFYNYSSNYGSYPNSILIDPQNNIYIAGITYTYYDEDSSNTLIVKYNTNGTFQWAHSYMGPDNFRDQGRTVGNDLSGNIFLGGFSEYIYNSVLQETKLLLIKYGTITGFEESLYNSDLLVYPNPATNELFIQLPEVKSEMNLTLINTLGQIVKETTISSGVKNLKLDIQSIPAGIYFLKIFNEENQFTQKVIITK